MDTKLTYSNAIMMADESPRWRRLEFLRNFSVENSIKVTTELPLINKADHINQNADGNFNEFETQDIIDLTGYNAEVMRPHGCGISAVFMALRTIGSNDFKLKYDTVGKFTVDTLAFHKNDFITNTERVVGTPVFNLKSGWYHDALVYSAINLGGINGFRMEELDGYDSVFNVIKQIGSNNCLAIVSVNNMFWRLKTEKSSVSTHMIVLNGFEYSKKGELSRIRVADSYAADLDFPKINTWIDVTDDIKKAFTGKAIFLYNDK